MAEAPKEEGKTLTPVEKIALKKKEAAAKAAAKAAKKDPFKDNGDGTISDPNSGLMWKKDDAWLDTNKFYTWMDHRPYVDQTNKDKFAGYEDWRLPSKAEAFTLFDKSKVCIDKNGTGFTLDPIFTEGCAAHTWITECSDDLIIRFDMKIGIEMPYPTNEVYASIRLVRAGKPPSSDPQAGSIPPAPPSKPSTSSG